MHFCKRSEVDNTSEQCHLGDSTEFHIVRTLENQLVKKKHLPYDLTSYHSQFQPPISFLTAKACRKLRGTKPSENCKAWPRSEENLVPD